MRSFHLPGSFPPVSSTDTGGPGNRAVRDRPVSGLIMLGVAFSLILPSAIATATAGNRSGSLEGGGGVTAGPATAAGAAAGGRRTPVSATAAHARPRQRLQPDRAVILVANLHGRDRHRSFARRPWRVAVLAPVGNTLTLVSETWSSTTPLDTLPGIMNRPIDQAASGRCVLAYLPEGKVIDLIGAARTADLAPRFAAIRDADGVDYASVADNPPGFAPGLSLVAAVIRAATVSRPGALIVSGTELEQYTSRDSEVALQLLRVAKQIGSVLG